MTAGSEDAWRPSASRLAVEARAALLADIRGFFAARDVLEVETPILSRAGNPDPNMTSLSTGEARTRYLRTSPEYPMKRLIAAAPRDIYELGRVFRDGESGRWHNPEFTLLEWYRVGWHYLDLADEVVALLRHCGHGQFEDWCCERLSYRELFLRYTGLDPFTATESDCRDLATEREITAGSLDLCDWLDLLLSHIVQPALAGDRITIVHDFPPDQAALARIRDGGEKTPVAERFEVFLGAVELANGYQELGDAEELTRRFERDNRVRSRRGDATVREDQALLEALRHGLPDCAGVALGVDRLLMACLGVQHIDMTLAFPSDRA